MSSAGTQAVACPARDDPAFIRAQAYVRFPGMTGVSAYRCAFDRAGYDDGLFARHGIAFHPTLERAVVKRKAEFLAGRYAAGRHSNGLACHTQALAWGRTAARHGRLA